MIDTMHLANLFSTGCRLQKELFSNLTIETVAVDYNKDSAKISMLPNYGTFNSGAKTGFKQEPLHNPQHSALCNG